MNRRSFFEMCAAALAYVGFPTSEAVSVELSRGGKRKIWRGDKPSYDRQAVSIEGDPTGGTTQLTYAGKTYIFKGGDDFADPSAWDPCLPAMRIDDTIVFESGRTDEWRAEFH